MRGWYPRHGFLGQGDGNKKSEMFLFFFYGISCVYWVDSKESVQKYRERVGKRFQGRGVWRSWWSWSSSWRRERVVLCGVARRSVPLLWSLD